MASTAGARKALLRKEVKAVLRGVTPEACLSQSAAVAAALYRLPVYRASRAVSVYLPIAGEVFTHDIIRQCLADDKAVYIPKVTGMRSEDMDMLKVTSVEQFLRFPVNKWNIPEPTDAEAEGMANGLDTGDIDLVLVPAMAFDARCNRLGRGKGFYDCFLGRLREVRAGQGRPDAGLVVSWLNGAGIFALYAYSIGICPKSVQPVHCIRTPTHPASHASLRPPLAPSPHPPTSIPSTSNTITVSPAPPSTSLPHHCSSCSTLLPPTYHVPRTSTTVTTRAWRLPNRLLMWCRRRTTTTPLI